MEGKENLKFIDGIHRKISGQKQSAQKSFSSRFLKSLLIFCLIFSFGILTLKSYFSYSEKTQQIGTSIGTAIKITKLAQNILGKNGEKKYLLLFQNTAEARPSGGFMGNYGLLTLNSGKVTDFKINDIYSLRWEYLHGKDFILPSQMPLSLISPDFSIHEGNWSNDFTTTAMRMEELFAQYTGQKPDGVIAVDPKLFEDVLEILGPIKMSDYDVLLTDKNFRKMIQFKVEWDNPFKRAEDPSANPKQILQDFAPLFLEKISQVPLSDKVKIFAKIFENLSQKHILVYSENPQVQSLLSNQNWSGQIQNSSKDFLLVSKSNVSGTKSSLKVEQKIDLTVNILSDGTVINKVTILGDGSNLSGEYLERIDTSLIQILVPLNSELIDVGYEGRDIPREKIYQFSEGSKTIFTYKDFSILPKEKKKITFQYKLPFKITNQENYSLLIQKQPGRLDDDLEVKINLADNFKIKENTPKDLEILDDQVKYQTNLQIDRFLDLIFVVPEDLIANQNFEI